MAKRKYTRRTQQTRIQDWKEELQRLVEASQVRELKIANLRDKINRAETVKSPEGVTRETPAQ